VARCAACHGETGKGGRPARPGGEPASDLIRADLRTHADGELYWVITNGIAGSGMPAFGTAMSEIERGQVVAFVRTLGGVQIDLRTAPTPGPVTSGICRPAPVLT
jgi:mono/diheme cytochrome c family protein